MQPNRACQRVSSNTVDSVTIGLHRTSTLDVSRALQCQHDLMFPESASFNFIKAWFINVIVFLFVQTMGVSRKREQQKLRTRLLHHSSYRISPRGLSLRGCLVLNLRNVAPSCKCEEEYRYNTGIKTFAVSVALVMCMWGIIIVLII